MSDDDETDIVPDYGDNMSCWDCWDTEDDEWPAVCLGCRADEDECLELGGCCTGCDHR